MLTLKDQNRLELRSDTTLIERLAQANTIIFYRQQENGHHRNANSETNPTKLKSLVRETFMSLHDATYHLKRFILNRCDLSCKFNTRVLKLSRANVSFENEMARFGDRLINS